MIRTALIIDLDNLYHAVKAKYGLTKIVMAKYVQELEGSGHLVMTKVAFGKRIPPPFHLVLTGLGFQVYNEPDKPTVQMALTSADVLSQIDCLVLGSNDPEIAPIFRWARRHGKITKCFSCRNRHLSDCASVMEVTPQILDNWGQPSEVPKTTKPMDLSSDIPSNGTRD